MRSTALLLTLAIAASGMAGQAGAQELIDATDPEAIEAILKGFGSARVDKAGDDTPMVAGRIEGTPFNVYFYECDDDDVNCRSVSFSASWPVETVTMDAVNDWNRRSRFGRAYLDDDGQPMLEYDVNLFGSVTEKNFEDSADWWRVILEDFETNIVEGGEEGSDQPSEQPAGADGTSL